MLDDNMQHMLSKVKACGWSRQGYVVGNPVRSYGSSSMKPSTGSFHPSRPGVPSPPAPRSGLILRDSSAGCQVGLSELQNPA